MEDEQGVVVNRIDELREKVDFRRLMNRQVTSAMHNIDSTIRIDLVMADRLIEIAERGQNLIEHWDRLQEGPVPDNHPIRGRVELLRESYSDEWNKEEPNVTGE